MLLRHCDMQMPAGPERDAALSEGTALGEVRTPTNTSSSRLIGGRAGTSTSTSGQPAHAHCLTRKMARHSHPTKYAPPQAAGAMESKNAATADATMARAEELLASMGVASNRLQQDEGARRSASGME